MHMVSASHGRSTAMVAAAMAMTLTATLSGQAPHEPDFCRVDTRGTEVLASRPAEGEAPVDDVNWFARPVPNPAGRWIVGFASHDQNYLYDLTRGRRVKMPTSPTRWPRPTAATSRCRRTTPRITP